MILCFLLPPFFSGCGEQDASLRLETFLQEERKDVRLNERLVLRFSHPLDRTSLCNTSVALRGRKGPARGRWEVHGREICFLPRLPLKPDGSDGGLFPGTDYTLLLKGFPHYEALRARSGACLNRSLHLHFRTAGGNDGSGVLSPNLFVDPVPGSGPELTAVEGVPVTDVGTEGVAVPAGSPLRLTFSEPLFPPSLEGGRTKLYVVNAEGSVDPALDALPLEAHLLPVSPEGCVVALGPRGGFEAGKRYKLYIEDLGFTDFGGRPVEKTRSYLDILCTPPPPS